MLSSASFRGINFCLFQHFDEKYGALLSTKAWCFTANGKPTVFVTSTNENTQKFSNLKNISGARKRFFSIPL